MTAKQIRRKHALSNLIWKVWTLVVVFGLLAVAFMMGYFPAMFGAKIVETELDHFGRAVNRIDTAYQSARDGVKYFGKAVKNVAENESIKRGSMIKAENGYVVIDNDGNAHFYKKASATAK